MRSARLVLTLALGCAPAAMASATVPPRASVVDSTSDSTRTLLSSLFGRSGKVRLVPLSAQRLFQRTTLPQLFGFAKPSDKLAVMAGRDGRVRPASVALDSGVQEASFVPLIPFTAKRGSMLRGYRIGWWPSERRGRRKPVSDTPLPEGFIEVHPSDTAAAVSEQFRIGDFLTHDQHEVWPKFLVLKPDLLDKLELVSAALQERGLPSRLRVMSGFRTPQYNAKGVGRRGGRAKDSRHMYGDASDVYVDADGDGVMDDLDGDGRITQDDARVLLAVAESVEEAHPELIGGMSAYKATDAHGPFVHVDVRGHRARW
jgi:hypothetical protein